MYGKTCMMDYDEFMARYIPPPAGKEEPKDLSSCTWSGAVRPENPCDNALAILKRCLKDAGNDEGYKPVVTADEADPLDETRQRCNLALYPRASAPNSTDEGTNWAGIEVFFECKPEAVYDDPFDEDAEKFEPTTQRRKEHLRQTISNANLVFINQHRTHLFSVVLFGELARVIRWDHSGVVVTKKFNYREEPIKLGRFLWRFCHLSATQRGHDPTVTYVPPRSPEHDLMERWAKEPILEDGHEIGKHARELFAQSITNQRERYKVVVDGRDFLVGRPHFVSSELAGRGTRCYVAIDCDKPEGPLVTLKDTWRVAHDGIEREGDVLALLNDEKIPGGRVEGVPTLVCHGDVGDQQMVSHAWRKALYPEKQSECPLETHRHYRLVVQEVCSPMSCLRDAGELVCLIFDCIKAHGQAYRRGVIHQDVNTSNVLVYVHETVVDGQLVQERVCILADWELSKKTNAPDTALQPGRTGTWQFMSAHTLSYPDEPIQISDEIEAFFHVLLFYAVRYLRHNYPDVGGFMYRYFDDFGHKNQGQYFCGQLNWDAMKTAFPPGFTPPPIEDAVPSKTHILNALITSLLRLFSARYTLHRLSKPPPGDAGDKPTEAPAQASAPLLGRYARMKHHMQHRPNAAAASTVQQDARPKVTAEERARLESLAAQLHSHEAIEDLFVSFFKDDLMERQWPPQDTVPDQLQNDYRPKNDTFEETGATSWPATGSKRMVTEDEDEREQQSNPKRPARITRSSAMPLT